MALAVNSNCSSRPSYIQEGQPSETRPFSYVKRPANSRVPYVIQDQPCVDSEIYFGQSNGLHPNEQRPPPRPPRSPKVSRIVPHKPPRTPPRSPLAGRANLSYSRSESDLRNHMGLRVPQPATPPPRTPPPNFGSKQMFFPSDEPAPRSPRVPPRSFHPPVIPAVPPRSPRLPPKPPKAPQLPPPHHQPQPPVVRSISNRSDRLERSQSGNARTDVQKMTRQTSADTVRLNPQSERELRAAPPPPVATSAITQQPRSANRSKEVDGNGRTSQQPKGSKSGDRQAMEMEKSAESKTCCQQCAKLCVNDIPEFLIELCLD
ncbi:uncharacterized protein [Diadema antillarum]|uniref:uncharacterized protein n=1 Tax=Diadema antillarum TaxID=105358 RepID=UPI003A87AE22